MFPQDVQATIQFIKWQDLYKREKPFITFLDLPTDHKEQRKSNVDFEDIRVRISDIRGMEDAFQLDIHGFMIAQLPPYTGSLDTATIRESHLPAVEKLLKSKVEEADRVFIFDWRVRAKLCTLLRVVVD